MRLGAAEIGAGRRFGDHETAWGTGSMPIDGILNAARVDTGLDSTRLDSCRTVPYRTRTVGGPWRTHECRETQMSHSPCAHVIIAGGRSVGAVVQKDGRCWAGIVGRGKGRSWSCAACVHEQGQGWVSSLSACLLAASFCIKPLTCCSSRGWA